MESWFLETELAIVAGGKRFAHTLEQVGNKWERNQTESGVLGSFFPAHEKTPERSFCSRIRGVFGDELSGTRTHDLRIKSPLLYRLSYELEEDGH